MSSAEIEKIGLGVFCLFEIILYYHLVIKPKLQAYMQAHFVSQKFYEAQYVYLKESLEEIKADIKQLVKNC